jgi:hypothetical protein
VSESSHYALVREAFDAVVAWATANKLTAVIAPHLAPWTLVVVEDLDDLASRRPPLALGYVYAADHGFDLSLLVHGKRVTRLSAASEVGHRYKLDNGAAFVEHGVWTREQHGALERLLASKQWHHEDVRDVVAKLAGFKVEDWLAWRYLEHDGWDLLDQRFPDAVHLVRGVPHVRDDEAELDELLRAEDADRSTQPRSAAKAAKATLAALAPSAKRPSEGRQGAKGAPAVAGAGKGTAKGQGKRPVLFTAEEGRAIAEAFRNAAPVVADRVEKVGHVDLAACTTPREWLDAKKRIDPKNATDAVVAELERTVREGRFLEDGDRAAVVREAAAMVLGRCLAQRAIDRVAWLETRRAAASSDAERAAWDIVATTAGVKQSK